MNGHQADAACWIAALVVPPLLLRAGTSLFKGKLFWLALTAAVLACWALIFFSEYFYWGWRADEAFARQASAQEMQDATADGANMIFTFVLGWIPASIYCSFWLLIFKVISLLKRRFQAIYDERRQREYSPSLEIDD